jgi:hypothetical protein
MRYRLIILCAGIIVARSLALASPSLIVSGNGSIGHNLEAFTSVRLSEPAPAGGLEVTVTSDDQTRLLVASQPNVAGTRSITLKVNPQYVETPDFYLQGFGDSGFVTYTVTAPGYGNAKGTITLAPSAIRIQGPYRAAEFRTSTGKPAPITITSGRLDGEGNFAQEQPIAGGLRVAVNLTTSDARIGSIAQTPVTLAGGATSSGTTFKPAGAGKTVITASAPSGFTISTKLGSLTAIVEVPGIGIMGEINIGKDLQVRGHVLLGEAAPPNGLDVTLSSSDPSKILLSQGEDQAGSGRITVRVPAGEVKAPYYIQGLTESGTVNYTATATGFRSREAPVTLAPSGVMVVFAPYGPPDEAEVKRRRLTLDPRPFTISLSEHRHAPLALWTVYLDPVSRRGGDITAQRLRPGVSPKVELNSSNPAVGKVPSTVTLSGASEFTPTEFIPLAAGQTVISVTTPLGFTTPSNATTVMATVKAE